MEKLICVEVLVSFFLCLCVYFCELFEMLLKATAFLQFLPQLYQAAKYKKVLFKVAHIRCLC